MEFPHDNKKNLNKIKPMIKICANFGSGSMFWIKYDWWLNDSFQLKTPKHELIEYGRTKLRNFQFKHCIPLKWIRLTAHVSLKHPYFLLNTPSVTQNPFISTFALPHTSQSVCQSHMPCLICFCHTAHTQYP